MYCRCPSCKELFEAQSKDFGNEIICANCKLKVVLDVEHLAHFNLPQEIIVQLVGERNNPLNLEGKAILADYGFKVGPIPTDSNGRSYFTKDMFDKAKGGIWRDRADWTLNRFIKFKIDTMQTSLDLEGISSKVELLFKV